MVLNNVEVPASRRPDAVTVGVEARVAGRPVKSPGLVLTLEAKGKRTA